ncbi:hypothetical protein D3C72_710140 [compost metagenome]
MDVDLNRAYFSTVTAQRRGKAQVAVFLHTGQVWRDYRAYWSAIGSTISMTTDIFIYRAGIQAGAAADAVHTLPYLFTQQVSTSVVQQDHIHFFRTIHFIGGLRSEK